jgi:hypothetical protein
VLRVHQLAALLLGKQSLTGHLQHPVQHKAESSGAPPIMRP